MWALPVSSGTFLLVLFDRGMAELWPFDAIAKNRHIRFGENVPHGMVVSSDSMIAPFPSDSIASSESFDQPSC